MSEGEVSLADAYARELGFETFDEADVYSYLLDYGPSTAYGVRSAHDMPMSACWAALKGLKKHGLVRRDPEGLYHVVHPEQ